MDVLYDAATCRGTSRAVPRKKWEVLDMKRILLAAALAVGFAGPAFASHCPTDIQAIDAALANNMNDEAKALRDQGAQLHADGRHDEALQALHEAMTMLGIEH